MTIDQHTCVEGGEAEEVTVTTELELEPEERTYSFIVYSFICFFLQSKLKFKISKDLLCTVCPSISPPGPPAMVRLLLSGFGNIG